MADFKITQKQFEKLMKRVDFLEGENKELRKGFDLLKPAAPAEVEEEKKEELKEEPKEPPKKKGLLEELFG